MARRFLDFEHTSSPTSKEGYHSHLSDILTTESQKGASSDHRLDPFQTPSVFSDSILSDFLRDERDKELSDKLKEFSKTLMKEVRKIKSADRFSKETNFRFYQALIWYLYNEREVKSHYLARAFGVSRGTIYKILMFYTDNHPLTNAGKRARNQYRNPFEKKESFDFEVSKIRAIKDLLDEWIKYYQWLGQTYLLKEDYNKAMNLREHPCYSQHFYVKKPLIKIAKVKTNHRAPIKYSTSPTRKDILEPILAPITVHRPP